MLICHLYIFPGEGLLRPLTRVSKLFIPVEL